MRGVNKRQVMVNEQLRVANSDQNPGTKTQEPNQLKNSNRKTQHN